MIVKNFRVNVLIQFSLVQQAQTMKKGELSPWGDHCLIAKRQEIAAREVGIELRGCSMAKAVRVPSCRVPQTAHVRVRSEKRCLR